MVWMVFLAVNALLPFALSEDRIVSIGSEPYPLRLLDENITCGSITWEIVVDNGFGTGLNIFIKHLFLESDDDHYLALSTESDMAGKASSVAYISGNISDINLATPAQKFYIQLERNECKDTENFEIELSRLYESVPITPPPKPNPNPPSGIPTEIPIHFSGKNVNAFSGLVPALCSILKEEATAYCTEHNMKCNLTKPVEETVFLKDIQSCPYAWRNYETCVVAWMAIYVSDPSDEYELSPNHLNELWEQIRAKEPNPFSSLGLEPYGYPNISIEISWWMLWIFIAVAIAGAAAYILWKMEDYREDVMEEIADINRQKIFEGVQLRRDIPMRPAKHQKIPAFMDPSTNEGSSVASAPATRKLFFRNIFPGSQNNSSPPLSPGSPEPPRLPIFFQNTAFDEEDEEEIFSKKM